MNFNKLIEISYALCNWPSHELRTFNISFLLRRSKILSIGINKKRTHTINLRNKKFSEKGEDVSHSKFQCAEFVTLKQSKNKIGNIDYNKCKLINIRIKRDNTIGLAAPCASCKSLLKHYSVGAVYYTTDDGNFEKYS